jgi:hypothetical protein
VALVVVIVVYILPGFLLYLGDMHRDEVFSVEWMALGSMERLK